MTTAIKPLSSVCLINPRHILKSHNKNETVSFVPMAAVSEETCTIIAEEERSLIEVTSGFTHFIKGDILIAKITPCYENGKCAIADITKNLGFGTTEFHVLRANPRYLDNRYLFHYIRSPQVRFTGELRMKGSAGQKRVPREFFEEIDIPLPPISEQVRIAAILDKADDIKRKRDVSLYLADNFLQNVYVDMFGDPITNPKGWEIRSLSEFITFLTSGSRGWAKYYSTQGDKFLRIQNVGRNRLFQKDMALVSPPNTKEAVRTKVKPNDLLISITADLGRTAVIPENFGVGYINQHLALLRLKGVEPLFISEFLKSEGGRIQFISMNRTGVKSGLNFNKGGIHFAGLLS